MNHDPGWNEPAHTLQCMEIWGGNQATNRTVSMPGLDLWVYSRPHENAAGGGDVHYVSLCGGGLTTRFILADVSGHGATVADLAKSLRGLMRKHINRKEQTRLVQALNREFTELAQLTRFATAIIATYLADTDTLTICNAGHPRPLYWQAKTETWSFLSHESSEDVAADGNLSPADLPLGILDETGYTQLEFKLGRNDLLLCYTDALSEAENEHGQQLGESGLLEVIRKLDPRQPQSIPKALVDAMQAIHGDRPVADDLTFLLLHHNSSPSRPPGLLQSFNVLAKVIGLKSV